MSLKTVTFLADKALWLRLLFYSYLGLKRAFMGTPPPPQDGTIIGAFTFRASHQRPQDPENEGASQLHRPLRKGKELGVTLVQFLGTGTPREERQSHLSWLQVQCSFLLFVISLQPLGLKQLRHQKCHISYDNTVCYITGAAEQTRGRGHEQEPQHPLPGSQDSWVPHTWWENSIWEGNTCPSIKEIKTIADICIIISRKPS